MSAALDALEARAQAAHGRRRADLLYQVGLEASLGGRFGRANEALGEALALEPRHEAARDALLRLWDGPGLDPGASVPAACDEPLKGELLCLRASAWMARGEPARARDDAQEALGLDPASRRARLLLAEAHSALGDWAGVARGLVEEAEVSLDERAQAACLRQAGMILSEVLGQTREGSHLLRRATGKGGRADFAVRRALRLERDDEALMAYARDEARRLGEGPARAGLALEAAALAALRLDDAAEARRILSQATPLVGGQEPDPDVLLALELAVALQHPGRPHPDDLGALRALGRLLVSPSRRAAVFSKIGRRTFEEEGLEEIEAEKGLRYLEAALDADPRYVEALEALEEAHEDGRLAVTRAGSGRRARGEELGRPEWLLKAATRLEAQGAYEEASGLLAKALAQCDEVELGSPGSPLERLLALSPPWELLRGALMEAGERARSAVMRRALWELLAREAWARGDEHSAGHALVRLVELDPDERFYVELLAALYARLGAWGALEEVRRREAAHCSGADPERAREAWVAAGRLRLLQGDSAGALACFREVLAQVPDDLAAIVGAGRILVREERWDELAQVFEAELACARDEAAIASIAFRCATLYERQIGDLERAWAGYERVRQLNAHHLPSLLGMIRLAARRHDWAAWARLVQEWAERERDDVLSGALLCELGHVQESSLGDLEAATASYRRSLERAPNLDLARLGLIRCLFRRGLRQEAVSVMRAALPEVQDPADRLDLLASSALLGDDERQGAAEVLAEFPEHASALLASFRTSLQDGATAQAGQAARALSEVLPPTELQAAFGRLAGLLGRLAGAGQEEHWIYEEARLLARADHAALAEHWARFARRLDVPRSRAQWLGAAARAAHGAKRHERARELYDLALLERPDSLSDAKGMRILLEGLREREGLATACEREGHLTQDRALALADMLKAADLRRRFLNDLDGAAADLEAVLRFEPTSREAFEQLRELLSKKGDSRGLCALLERRAQALGGSPEAANMWMVAAQVALDRLLDPERAARCYRRVLALEPGHIQALRILARLASDAQRWEEAAQHLGRVLTLVQEPSLLAQTWQDLATLYDQHLKDQARAREAYQSLLTHDPERASALRRLAELLQDAGEWEEAARTYGRLLQREKDRKRLTQDLLGLARVCVQGLQDPDKAEQCLTQALRLEPLNLDVHRALVEMLEARGLKERLEAHLAQASRQFGAALSQERQRPAALQGFLQVARWRKSPDRAFIVASMAHELGLADEESKRLLQRGRAALQRMGLPKTIPVDKTDATLPGDLQLSFLHALRFADEALRKMFPPNLQRLNLGRKTLLRERDSRAGVLAVLRWPGLFSLPEMAVHVVPEALPAPIACVLEEPTLVLSEDLLARVGRQDANAFLELGFALAPLCMGLGGFFGLPEELRVPAVAGLVRRIVPTWMAQDARANHPELTPEKYGRFLRKPDQALMPHALDLSGRLDVGGISEQQRVLQRAFRRLASVPVFDLAPLLDGLAKHADAEAKNDLVLFFSTDRFAELRVAVGVALKDE